MKTYSQSKCKSAPTMKRFFTAHMKKSMSSYKAVRKRKPRHSDWYCGIVNKNLIQEIEESGKYNEIKNWKAIKAKNTKAAYDVETYYRLKGAVSLPSHKRIQDDEVYVFVFRKPRNEKIAENAPALLYIEDYLSIVANDRLKI